MELVSLMNGSYAHYRCAVLGWAARKISCPGCGRVPCDQSSGACLRWSGSPTFAEVLTGIDTGKAYTQPPEGPSK